MKNTLVLAAAALCISSTVLVANAGAELRVHLNFEDGLVDSAGGDNNGTLIDGAVGTNGFVSGKTGQALQLQNGDDVIAEGDSVSITYTMPDAGTFALWYKPTAFYNWNTILDNSSNTDDWEMWTYADSGVKFRVDGGTEVTTNLNALAGDGNALDKWWHIAITWQKTGTTVSVNLYVNGALQDQSTTGPWVVPGTTVFLGGGGAGNDRGSGVYDDMRLYNHVLTAGDLVGLLYYSGGSGTTANPYKISTVADWQTLTTRPGDWTGQFVLTADLDFAGMAITPVAPDTIPGDVGFTGTAFTGILDGAGHTLSSFVINETNSDFVGLFGYINSGQVRNLGVVNANIQGRDYVGGLVGMINSGNITSCYATGAVSGETQVGGLVGGASGTITSCYATGTVSGTDFVGGLVGYTAGNITFCYATGTVSGSTYVGGLVGYLLSSITACFWDTDTSATTDGVGNQNPDPSGAAGKTTAEMKTLTTFVWAGWDCIHTWVMPCEDYPRLLWEKKTYSGGSGTAEYPYQIGCVADWQLLIKRPGDWGKRFVLTADLDFEGMVIAPVAADTIPNVTTITFDGPAFSGILDGAGHTLSNLKIYQPEADYIGLFGYVGGGQVKDLGMVNAIIRGNIFVGGMVGWNGGTITSCNTAGTVNGRQYVGGLVGMNQYGTIISCSATATATGSSTYVGGLVGEHYSGMIRSCCATGTANGGSSVGGLVGVNRSTITSCYATGPVSGTSRKVGGLAGWSDTGTISACYATGAVNGAGDVGGLVGYFYSGTLASCYATGAVMGSTMVGGLCGTNTGTTSGCFWDVLTSWQTTSAGGTGKTTAEMQRQATFTDAGWDFDTVWAIKENKSYPSLRNMPYLKGSADLNGDGRVDLADFALFAEQWMEGI